MMAEQEQSRENKDKKAQGQGSGPSAESRKHANHGRAVFKGLMFALVPAAILWALIFWALKLF